MPKPKRRSRTRGALPFSVGVALTAAACESPGGRPAAAPSERGDVRAVATTPAASSATAALTAPTAASADAATAELRAELERQAVFDESPARATLYTWTTREQIDALRRGEEPLLLSRQEHPTFGASAFDRAVAKAPKGDPGAEVFARADGGTRRFAWANPWATVMGTPDEDYGDHLLRIQLRADSIFASFDAETKRWRFFDLRGDALTASEAYDRADRLAAVYHVAAAPSRFREFVLCNELQIESWSYAGPRMVEAMERYEQMLERLVELTRAEGGPRLLGAALDAAAESGWPHRPERGRLTDAYVANLSLVSHLYELEPGKLQAVLARFRRLRRELREAPPIARTLDREAVRRAVLLRRKTEVKKPVAPPRPPSPRGTFFVTY